jgi:hypothetical protein
VSCLLKLVIVSFDVQKLFHLFQLSLSLLVLFLRQLNSHSEHNCPYLYLPVFSLGFFVVFSSLRSYIKIFHPLWLDFCHRQELKRTSLMLLHINNHCFGKLFFMNIFKIVIVSL